MGSNLVWFRPAQESLVWKLIGLISMRHFLFHLQKHRYRLAVEMLPGLLL